VIVEWSEGDCLKLELKRLTLEKWAALVTIIGFPLLFVSLYYAAHQDGVIITSVDKLRAIARSQNNIALSQMFFGDPRNLGIIEAIENKKPILNTNGGQFSGTQLDKYLGDLETIYDVYDEKLLSDDELCERAGEPFLPCGQMLPAGGWQERSSLKFR
jgi:hypothetical protein